ncbi:hypothetical protein FACS189432_08590 [Bacteroidia bacterium]|nr:hypothetical protein FACS189426_03140 [Bacteroidia bacterium]GHT29457.1 hypothetical protein FACS189432_08590 [Bacteroidia bacterium]
MNKKFITFVFLSLSILTLAFYACKDDGNDSESGRREINVITYSPVVAGQKISITGSNVAQTTAVVFSPNVETKDFTFVGKFEISVVVPTGAQSGTITLKTANGDVVSTQSIVIANPTITAADEIVVAGEVLSIRGKDLGSIEQVIFPEEIVINALDFKWKTNTEIRVTVPQQIAEGTYILDLISSGGLALHTPSIEISNTGGPEPEPEVFIMVNDFEEHGGHNGGWDLGWNTSNTEIVTEDGNSYLRVKAAIPNEWIFNCNHQSSGGVGGAIENIENYVFRMDVKIENGVSGAENADMQVVLGDSWNWYGTGLLPASTDGQWKTIEVPVSRWSLTGTLNLSSGTNGIYGGPVPAGVCFDNMRFTLVKKD